MISVVAEETGLGRANANGDGIEHFGYVDGRSQPLFLEEDVQAERDHHDGITNWDPRFPLTMVVTPDPLGANAGTQFGSYFVFRKLEQNVAAFKAAEQMVAEKLDLSGADVERAGAMLVGRFEDGTPLTLQSAGGMDSPVPNDFTYDSDPDGAKCPFHAHIRKTNPRGSGGFEEVDITFAESKAVGGERSHLMARRGQTYGERYDDPTDPDVQPHERPIDGVGLLFMAFNTILDNQFEFTQPRVGQLRGVPTQAHGHPQPGLDPVIGQGDRPGTDVLHCPVAWGQGPTTRWTRCSRR